MVEYNAEEIPGPWTGGYSLDRHTVSSEYLGDDPYGVPEYHTVRTPLDELLFKLKYRGDQSVLDEIVETAADFFESMEPASRSHRPGPAEQRVPQAPARDFDRSPHRSPHGERAL